MLTPRWRVVAALFIVTCSVVTAMTAFGVFLPVLSAEQGWRRGALSVALSINLVVGGVTAFAIGHVADRHGPRGVLALTLLVGAAGFAASSRIEALWQLYLTYGVLVGIGMSSVYVLATTTVARWFDDRRGLALAVVLTGFNLGWIAAGPLTAFLIRQWGWRGAFLALAALVACIGLPATGWVRFPAGGSVAVRPGAGRPHAPAGTGLRQAMSGSRLWYLVGSWFLLGSVYMTMTVHAVPYARDLGLPLEGAALALTAYGLGSAVGRLGAGMLADRAGVRVVMTAMVLAQVVALVMLMARPPAWAALPLLVLFGIGAAGADNTFVKVIPDVFGMVALARITSVLSLAWRCGAAAGPAGAGYVHDLTGSYALAFGAGAIALAAGLALFWRGIHTLRSAGALAGRPPLGG
jgi:MFS family permease